MVQTIFALGIVADTGQAPNASCSMSGKPGRFYQRQRPKATKNKKGDDPSPPFYISFLKELVHQSLFLVINRS